MDSQVLPSDARNEILLKVNAQFHLAMKGTYLSTDKESFILLTFTSALTMQSCTGGPLDCSIQYLWLNDKSHVFYVSRFHYRLNRSKN